MKFEYRDAKRAAGLDDLVWQHQSADGFAVALTRCMCDTSESRDTLNRPILLVTFL